MTFAPAARRFAWAICSILAVGAFVATAGGQQAPQAEAAADAADKATLPLDKLPAIEKPTNPAEAPEMHRQAAKAYEEGIELLDKRDYLGAVNKLERAVGFNPKNAAIRRALAMAYAGLRNWGKAYEHIEKAVELVGDDLEGQVLYGKLAMERRELPTAMKAFRTALLTSDAKPSNPRAAFALVQLADVLDRQGYTQASLDAYNQFSQWLGEHGPDYSGIDELKDLALRPQLLYLRQGLLLSRLGRHKEAVEPLARAWSRDHSSGLTAQLLIRALIKADDPKSAAKRLLEVASEPDLVGLLPELASEVIVAAAGEKDLPRRIWDVAAESRQDSVTLAATLATAAEKAGNLDAAVSVLEAAVKTHADPSLGEALTRAYVKASASVDGSNAVDAIERLAELLARKPAVDSALRGAIVSLAQKDLPDDVLDQLTARAAKADKPASLHYLTGRLAQQLSKDDEAAAAFTRALEADKSFVPALQAIVDAYLAQRKFEEAEKALEQLGDGRDPMALYLRGKVKLVRKDAAEALKLLSEAAEADPRNVPVLLMLAEAQVRVGQEAEALGTRLRALEQAPSDLDVYAALVRMMIRRGGLNEASGMADRGASRNPEDPRAQVLQAEVAYARNDEEKLAKILDELKKQAPDQADVKVLLIKQQLRAEPGLLERKSWDQVVSQLNEITFRNPRNVAGQHLLAQLLRTHAMYATATAVYRELYDLTSARPDIAFEYAQTLVRAEKLDQAAEVLRQVLANDPKSYTAQRELVDLLRRQKKWNEAEEALRGWLKAAGRDAFAAWYRLVLLDILEKAGKYDEALELIDERIAADASDADGLRHQRIGVLIEAGRFDEAIKAAATWAGEIQAKIDALGDNGDPDERAELINSRDVVRGVLIYRLGDAKQYDRVQKLLDEWIAGRTDASAENYRLLKIIYLGEQDKITEAGDAAIAWIRQSPTALVPRQTLAQLLIEKDKHDDAIALVEKWIGDLERIVETEPMQADAAKVTLEAMRRTLPVVQIEKGDHKAALKTLQALLKVMPNEPSLLSLQATCYGEMGNDDEQTRIMEKLVGLAPGDPLYTNNLGYFLADKGKQLARAEELIRTSLRSNPESVATLDSLAWVMYKQGRFGESAELFLRIVEMGQAAAAEDPDGPAAVHAIIYDHAGDAFWRLGWKKLAVETWQYALKAAAAEKRDSADLKFVKERTPAKIKAVEDKQEPTVADYDKDFKPPQGARRARPVPDDGELRLIPF